MRAKFGEWAGRALASPLPVGPIPLRQSERRLLAAVAALAGVWILIFKLQCFNGLETTSDLYSQYQRTVSWLDGRPYHDNYFGFVFRTHTYFLAPLLSVLTWPLGVAGLFVALALAVAAQLVAVVRILQLLGVAFAPALAWAAAATLMPLSMHVYQNSVYAFHLELLEPAVALWLAYFLLRRAWGGALATAAVLILFKEDAPLLVVVVAGVVLVEGWVRSRGREWNRPALAALGLALLSLPLLLWLLKSQQEAGAPGVLGRVSAPGVTSNQALLGYVAGNIGTWLRSPVTTEWLALALPATFGLVLLRPHLLVIGLATTLIAWLVGESVLWSPRFVQALVFFQLVGALGLASVQRLPGRRLMAGVLALGLLGGFYWQWQAVPRTAEVYRLAPVLPLDAAARQQAASLFATYERMARPGEPVVASPLLFRFARPRDLYWHNRLQGRPKPEWILWDREELPLAGLWAHLKSGTGSEPADYRLVEQAGRFLLLRRATPDQLRGLPRVPVPVIAGEPRGAVRLRLEFPRMFEGVTEPLLAVGTKEGGEVFFVRYADDQWLTFGWEDRAGRRHTSGRVAYEPGRAYELLLFSGSLGSGPGNRVYIGWEGREILAQALERPVPAGETLALGENAAAKDGIRPWFTGRILAAERGVKVPSVSPGKSEASLGAIQLVVDLPGGAAGVPEPLLVLGHTGEATLVYLRLMSGNRAAVGVEFWGFGVKESDPFPLVNPGQATITVFLPAFFPQEQDWRWGDAPAALRLDRLSRVRVVVDGATRLDAPASATTPREAAPAYGTNPAGGSWVGPAFTGRIVTVTRQPVDAP